MSKVVPGGLKPQECKQGSGRVKLKILYIPEKDELQEAVEGTALIKLILPTKVELQVSVWSHGTPEKFILHILQAIPVIKKRAYKGTTKKLVPAKKECM